MIVPMKKVSVILLREEKKTALKELRRLGLVHIEISEGAGERLAVLRDEIARLEGAIYTVAPLAKGQESAAFTSADDALAVADRITEIGGEIEVCRQKLLHGERELARLADWGDIDPATFDALSARGLSLIPYQMPTREYEKLDDTVTTLLFREGKQNTCFLVIRSGHAGEEKALDALRPYRVELPKVSTERMRQRVETARARLAALEEERTALACHVQNMKRAIAARNKDVEFETYDSGMPDEDLSREGGGIAVAYFRGFIRAEDLPKLQETARAHAWGLLAEDPTEEDNAPTELRNNRFVSLIYPLTDFLGTVPGYFEYDISGWFLGFILIFFGIIFGDGGYGLLILAGAGVLIGRNVIQKKPIPAAFWLVGLFGVSTLLWGTITCSWFAISPALLPTWLTKLSIPFLSNVYADTLWYPPWTDGAAGLTTSQNVQIFCFALALVQLSVAHLMGAIRNRRSLKLLGDLGSVLELFGIFYIVLALVVNGQVFPIGLTIGGIPVGICAVAGIGVGFLMSFVFSNYEGNLMKSILASMKNIVSVLLGVVNVFSDIVSYIRLWAVGLAGAAISATVNELAGPMLGKLAFAVFAIIILVFGHGLNIILNVLSLIVHGIRLNTLEFSSHLGMSWSGHRYQPFRE